MNMRDVHGFGMTEVLVALLVFALGISGALALALGGLASTAEARRADLATSLVADLAGRTRAFGELDWTILPAALPCGGSCTPSQLAALELADWQSLVAATLPSGVATLETGTAGELVVVLTWDETGGARRELQMGIGR